MAWELLPEGHPLDDGEANSRGGERQVRRVRGSGLVRQLPPRDRYAELFVPLMFQLMAVLSLGAYFAVALSTGSGRASLALRGRPPGSLSPP